MNSRAIAVVAAVVIVLAGCAVAPGASQEASTEPSSASVGPTTEATSQASVAPSQAPTTGLAVDAFADVVADRLIVRQAPGLESDPVPLCIADAPTCAAAMIGQETDCPVVYLLEGPVGADGYDWYRAVAEASDACPEYVGWIAAGDGEDAWLARREVPCPEAPVELADVTFAGISRLAALYCLGGEEITLHGYYTAPPPGESPGGDCVSEPGWLICTLGYDMLRVEEGTWVGDANHLQIHPHPDLGPMPPRPGWIEVTGQFDHPAAAECGADFELTCRQGFVVTSARASE
jgi:hypothetical protein